MAAAGAGRLADWLVRLCDLHDRARRGGLDDDERAEYVGAREELAELLVLGQRLELKAGEDARRAVRVSRALQVELELPGGRASFLTRDVSIGGLCALVDDALPVGTSLAFRLKLGRDSEPVAGQCRVVGAEASGGAVRLSVEFEALSPEETDRIQTVVFDSVCASLRMAGVRGH